MILKKRILSCVVLMFLLVGCGSQVSSIDPTTSDGTSQVTHGPKDEWEYDDEYHWHSCSAEGCSDETHIYDKAPHTWDEGVVTTEPCCGTETNGVKTYTCTVCSATKTEEIPYEHHFGNIWQYDETGHWHECVHSGCNARSDFAPHEYGEWEEKEPAKYDTYAVLHRTCTVCGYEETKPGSEYRIINNSWDILDDGGITNNMANAIGSITNVEVPEIGDFAVKTDVVIQAGSGTRPCLIFKANIFDEDEIRPKAPDAPDDKGTFQDPDFEYYCFYFNSGSGATSIAHILDATWNQTSIINIKSSTTGALKAKLDAFYASGNEEPLSITMGVYLTETTIYTFIDGVPMSKAEFSNASLVAPVNAGTKVGIRNTVANAATFKNFAVNDGSEFKATATFAACDGVEPITVVKGEQITMPTVASAGLNFVGWALTENGAKVHDAGDVVTLTKDTVFYALFSTKTLIKYTNVVKGYTGTVPANVEKEATDTFTAEDLPDLAKPFYNFLGWYKGETKVNVGDPVGSEEVTLKATWEKSADAEDPLKTYTYAGAPVMVTNEAAVEAFNDEVYHNLHLKSSSVAKTDLTLDEGLIEFFYTFKKTSSNAGLGILLRASSIENCTSGSGTGFWGKYGGIYCEMPTNATNPAKLIFYGGTASISGSNGITIGDNTGAFVDGTTYKMGLRVTNLYSEDPTPVLTGIQVLVYQDDVLITEAIFTHESVLQGTGTQVGVRANGAQNQGGFYGIRKVIE